MKMLTKLLTCLAVMCATLSFGAEGAFAQDVSKEEVKRFQKHLEEGGALVEKGEYEDGIIELKRARRIIDHPKISVSIARAYYKWGRCDKAQKEYNKLVARDKLSEDIRKKVAEGLDGMDECVDTGVLAIRCSPEEAVVQIDRSDKQLTCPVETDLQVGKHRITVTADGHKSKTETTVIEVGQTTQLSVSLSPKTPAVKVEKPDVPEKVEPVASPEMVEPAWVGWASWGSIGAGTALVGLGVYNDVLSIERTDKIAEAQQTGDFGYVEELEAEADEAYTRGIIFYSSGAVLLATGITLQVMDFETEAQPQQPYADARPRASIFFTGSGVAGRLEW